MSYIPKDAVTQSFKSNKGVLTPNQLIELDNENKFTKFGQLELIETQNVTSAVSNIDFVDLKEDIYDEHLLTCNNVETLTDTRHLVAKFSNDGGATFETSSYINSYLSNNGAGGQASGVNSFLQYLSSSLGTGTNERGNGFVKFYNLGNSQFRGTCNSVFSDFNASAAHQTSLGFAQRNEYERVNAIRLTGHASTTWKGSFSLYGVREY
jgi:hypothetical protein